MSEARRRLREAAGLIELAQGPGVAQPPPPEPEQPASDAQPLRQRRVRHAAGTSRTRKRAAVSDAEEPEVREPEQPVETPVTQDPGFVAEGVPLPTPGSVWSPNFEDGAFIDRHLAQEGIPASMGGDVGQLLDFMVPNALRFATGAHLVRARVRGLEAEVTALRTSKARMEREMNILRARIQEEGGKVTEALQRLALSETENQTLRSDALLRAERLRQLEEQLGIVNAQLATLEETCAGLRASSEQLPVLQQNYNRLAGLCQNMVHDSFENAVSQLQIVNPNLITDGIGANYVVVNGQIMDARDAPEDDDDDEGNMGDPGAGSSWQAPDGGVVDDGAEASDGGEDLGDGEDAGAGDQP